MAANKKPSRLGFRGYDKVTEEYNTLEFTTSDKIPSKTTREYQPGKTLWDWLQLLIIPLVLAAGAIWFNMQQSQTSLQVSERQHQTDIQIAKDQQRETTLKTYLDDMSNLLLNNKLLESKPRDVVRQVARERTLTTLRRLDANRNRIVLKFLQDTNLISGKNAVIDLSNADLSNDDLSGADLSNADLRNADLSNADLRNADLRNADLSVANLSGASLRFAHLRIVDLSGAKLSGDDLSGADLGEADLSNVDLSNAKLGGDGLFLADLWEANLSSADLRGAKLNYADLRGATLSGAKLDKTVLEGIRYNTKEILVKDSQGNILVKVPATTWPQGFNSKAAGAIEENTLIYADLRGADLSNADLRGDDLRGAKLSGADLWGADLSRANLSSADLSGAHLNQANLNQVNLWFANLSSADLWEANLSSTFPEEADLSNANLSGVSTLTQFQLDQVKSCKGATLPKGLTCHHNQSPP